MSIRRDPEDVPDREPERLLEIRRRSRLSRHDDAEVPRPLRDGQGAAEEIRPRRYQSWNLRPKSGRQSTQRIAEGEPQPRFRSLALARLTKEGMGPREAGGAHGHRWRALRDHALLVIEVMAVLGLVLLLVSGTLQLRFLNQETAEALEANVATPTPVQILPGGSTPPTPAPLPGIYERLIRRVTPIVIPTPGIEAPTRIVIEKIGVDAPIVQGDGWEELKKGVGHHIGSANPGSRGNMVLSAHDDVFGETFRYLNKLEPNDVVAIYANQRAFKYVVKGKRIVEATEVSVMAHTQEPTATLITCYPYRVDTHRLVVFAELAP